MTMIPKQVMPYFFQFYNTSVFSVPSPPLGIQLGQSLVV